MISIIYAVIDSPCDLSLIHDVNPTETPASQNENYHKKGSPFPEHTLPGVIVQRVPGVLPGPVPVQVPPSHGLLLLHACDDPGRHPPPWF